MLYLLPGNCRDRGSLRAKQRGPELPQTRRSGALIKAAGPLNAEFRERGSGFTMSNMQKMPHFGRASAAWILEIGTAKVPPLSFLNGCH
jgi:hypothetical protein